MKKKYSLVGIDGNAYAIMGYVTKAMKETSHTKEEIDAYLNDAKSSDYSHLVAVSSDMIDDINNMKSENELDKWFRGLDSNELAMIFPGEYDEVMMSTDPDVNINTFYKEARRTWNLMPVSEKTRIYKEMN